MILFMILKDFLFEILFVSKCFMGTKLTKFILLNHAKKKKHIDTMTLFSLISKIPEILHYHLLYIQVFSLYTSHLPSSLRPV